MLIKSIATAKANRRIKMRKVVFYVLLGWATSFSISSYAQTNKAVTGWEYTIEYAIDLKNSRSLEIKEPAYYLLLLKQGVRQGDVVADELQVCRKGDKGYLIVKSSIASLIKNNSLYEGLWKVNNLWKLSANTQGAAASALETFTLKSNEPLKTLHKLNAVPEIKVLSVNEDILKVSCTYNLLVTQLISFEEVVYAGKEAGNPTNRRAGKRHEFGAERH